jgi:hypothetical protein
MREGDIVAVLRRKYVLGFTTIERAGILSNLHRCKNDSTLFALERLLVSDGSKNSRTFGWKETNVC